MKKIQTANVINNTVVILHRSVTVHDRHTSLRKAVRLYRGGGGYLVERWVRGCAAQIGCFFGLSGFAMAPFLFENWFRYRSRFCKMHNFR